MKCEICKDNKTVIVHGLIDGPVELPCNCTCDKPKINKIPFKIVKIETYTGTIESAQELVSRLLLKGNYSFDVNNKTLIDHVRGALYRPGDLYQYLIHEEFKAL